MQHLFLMALALHQWETALCHISPTEDFVAMLVEFTTTFTDNSSQK